MNQRIFERTLRSLVFRGACLFECHGILNPHILVMLVRLGLGGLLARRGRLLLNALAWFLADRLSV